MYKIIVVGDSNVGKSNISIRISQDKFLSEMRTTIGLDTHLVSREVSKLSSQLKTNVKYFNLGLALWVI